MELGLVHLTDPRLSGFVAESRAFYARRVAGRGPGSPEELRAIRAMAAAPAPSYPPAVVEVVGTGGRSVPVRIHLPESGEVAGVFLEIHGGGFYLGSAAGSDPLDDPCTGKPVSWDGASLAGVRVGGGRVW